MKVLGAKGTQFPKSTITATVKTHRYGASATISQDSDKLYVGKRYFVELFGFKNNIKPNIFYTVFGSDTTDVKSAYASGRLGFGIYQQTDRWYDASYSGSDPYLQYPVIPDYYETAWTQAGVDAFGVTLGAAKTSRTPNHGQELFDVSGGVYGYDIATESYGTNNGLELSTLIEYEINELEKILGHKVTIISYRNGQNQGSHELLPFISYGRDSGFSTSGNSDIEYRGFSRYGFLNKNSSTRWWDMWNYYGFTEAQASAYSTQEIGKAISNNGWFNDFIHWHNCYDADDMDAINRYYAVINAAIGSDFVYRASNNEAANYAFYRDMVSRISAFEEDSKVYIVIQKKDNYKGTDTDGIDNDLPLGGMATPVSVEIDLSATSLAGKNIITNTTGIRSLGSDVYIVDIPFGNAKEGFQRCILEEGTADYYDFTLPVISSDSVSSEVLTVVTDKPTNMVLFAATRGADVSTAVMLLRDNTMETTHTVNLSTADQGKDIYIGVVTREGQSILSPVKQYA